MNPQAISVSPQTSESCRDHETRREGRHSRTMATQDSLARFRRRERTTVAAVRLDLETEGFTYRKWGATQHCKPGDWIVCNAGDTYTVDAEVFERSYREIGLGVYAKITPVWAELAQESGSIATKEGATNYQAGDMLVYNDSSRTDGYAMAAVVFESLYELDER